jgi:hypothetical protein
LYSVMPLSTRFKVLLGNEEGISGTDKVLFVILSRANMV